MTKIAIVDSNDEVIGSKEQQQAEEDGDIFRLVRIFVANSQGQILLQLRSPKKRIQPNKWDQSVGGHVDEGEDYLTAAKREVLEELGISDVAFTEIGKYYKESVINGINHKKFNTIYKINYDGDVSFPEEEIAEIKWFNREELDDLVNIQPELFTFGFIESYKIFRDTA